MADEGTGDTFEKTLGGRSIQFYHMGYAQRLMLGRYTDTLKAQMDAADAAKDEKEVTRLLLELNTVTWTAVESLFVNPDDITFVQMGIIGRTISDTDVLTIFSGAGSPAPADDEDPPAPKKRAPRKTAPAPAKANPRRAKK